jgi:hypothetical protein
MTRMGVCPAPVTRGRGPTNDRFLGVYGTKKAGAPKDPGQEVNVPRSVGTQEQQATIPEEEEGYK